MDTFRLESCRWKAKHWASWTDGALAGCPGIRQALQVLQNYCPAHHAKRSGLLRCLCASNGSEAKLLHKQHYICAPDRQAGSSTLDLGLQSAFQGQTMQRRLDTGI